MPVVAWAQLIEQAAPRAMKDGNRSARAQTVPPAISLPLWDDFSTTPGEQPDTLWVDSETVSVNYGNGRNAPTMRVATFDGLNENGIPYATNPSDFLLFGITDSLISRPIKMTEVTLPERNSVFLSFLYQWSGYGETADDRDYLELSFRKNDNTWVTILTLRATELIKPDTFNQVRIRINQDEYFHDNFQFRLRSSGRKSGYYDTWNVDYFYLDKGRPEDELADYSDKAMSSQVSPFLKHQYNAAPRRHFYDDPVGNSVVPNVYISQLFSEQGNTRNTTLFASIYALNKDNTSFAEDVVVYHNKPGEVIAEFEVLNVSLERAPDLTPYSAYDSLVRVTISASIDTGEFSFPGHTLRYPTEVNNLVTQEHVLNDYYAYDDGSAEGTAGLTGTGQQAVVRFPMLWSQQDTINAVSVYFAYHGQNAPSTVRLVIYDNDHGEPGTLLYEETIPAQQQPLNTFLKHTLQQGVIVKDTFFIGWEEFTAAKVARIGLDKNNNTGSQIFTNTNGTWELNDRVEGSLMFRPHFGFGETIITNIPEEPAPVVHLYPNPTSGTFYLSTHVHDLRMTNSAGHPVSCTWTTTDGKTEVTTAAAPGLYVVQFSEGAHIYTRKVMVR
jgi:hypothetical protein